MVTYQMYGGMLNYKYLNLISPFMTVVVAYERCASTMKKVKKHHECNKMSVTHDNQPIFRARARRAGSFCRDADFMF